MSDIMKTAIILTYNCPKQDIDEALRRKGRLQMDYEFGLLKKDDAIKLAQSLNFPQEFIDEEIKEDMSLADIYNSKQKLISKRRKKKSLIVSLDLEHVKLQSTKSTNPCRVI
jgi:hypothetical protein